MRFMKQVFYASVPETSILPITRNTQISFHLNTSGRLVKIVRTYITNDGKTYKNQFAKSDEDGWDLNEVSESDLIQAFRELAFQNPREFRELYYVLKKHDAITFPSIRATLNQIKKTFKFK